MLPLLLCIFSVWLKANESCGIQFAAYSKYKNIVPVPVPVHDGKHHAWFLSPRRDTQAATVTTDLWS